MFNCSVMSDFLWPHGLQHARLPVYHQLPELTQTRPSSQWSHPIISSSIIPFSSCPQCPSIRVFSKESVLCIRWPNIGASASASVLPMNIQDLFPLGWTGWISLQFKWLSRVFSSTIVKKHPFFRFSAFFIVQLTHSFMTTGKITALTEWTFVGKVMSLLFNMLSRLVITFLPRRKRLLISWLQSPSAVIWEPKIIKSLTVSIIFPFICHEVMGPDAMILVFWMLSFKPTCCSPLSLSSGGSLVLLYFLP